MKHPIALLAVCALVVPVVQAQTCTENGLDGFNVTFPYGSGGNGQSIGQIFTACGTGVVDSITINEGAASTAGAYDLWIATEAGGFNGAYTGGAPTAVIADPGGAFPRFTTLALATPFPVTAGTAYRFVLNKAGTIDIRCTNLTSPSDYDGGEATDDAGTYPDFDLDFELAILTACSVPALPSWGEVTLVLLLLGSALVVSGRRAA